MIEGSPHFFEKPIAFSLHQGHEIGFNAIAIAGRWNRGDVNMYTQTTIRDLQYVTLNNTLQLNALAKMNYQYYSSLIMLGNANTIVHVIF